MWDLIDSDDSGYRADLKRISKTHPRDVEALFERLSQLIVCLNSGMPLPLALQRGWIHHKYKQGMKSIDNGGGKGKAKLRLYILPEQRYNAVVVLGIGEKVDESRAISRAYEVLDAFLRAMEQGGRT